MSKNPIYLIVLTLVLGLAQASPGAWDPNTDPSLIARWKCDEGQGSTVSDSSPNQRSGTFVNGSPAWTVGIRGGAVTLVGPTVVEVPALNMTLTEATIMGWLRPNGAQPQWAAMIMHRSSAAGSAHGFNFLNDGHLAYHWNDVAATYNYRGSAFYALDDWTHCALTIEPTKATFYVNGVAASVNAIAHAAATWDGTFWLGGDGSSNQVARRMNGALDDVAFFSRALTAAEIKSMIPNRPKARKPSPSDGATDIPMFQVLSWTRGDTAASHDVYFGTDPDALTLMPNPLPKMPRWISPVLEPGTTYYWRVDERDAQGRVFTGDVWHFFCTPLTAWQPSPADEAEGVSPLTKLAWSSGLEAISHRVYLSTQAEEVRTRAAAADMGRPESGTTLDPGMLHAMTTYYWCVDETDAFDAVQAGPVWSFTTASGEQGKILRQWWSGISGTAVTALTGNANYPSNPSGSALLDRFASPVNWGDNYGQRLCGWLKPPEDGDYTFWIAGDDNQELRLSTDENPANAVAIAQVTGYTGAEDFDRASGTADAALMKSAPIALKKGFKYYIEALGKEGTGGDHASVAWQGGSITAREVIAGQYVDTFALPPLMAYGPTPADGAVDVDAVPVPTLSWMPGANAATHELYFGDDANAVTAADAASPLFMGSQAGTTFVPGPLDFNETYYWRVDEVASGDPRTVWKGRVWSFTTAAFIRVDDIEGYTEDYENLGCIYQTWIDGTGFTTPLDTPGNGSGAAVGHPTWDQTSVYYNTTTVETGFRTPGSTQSMPLYYFNGGPKSYSEAVRTWTTPQMFTGEGLTDLSLWVYGFSQGPQSITVTENPAGSMTLTGGGADIWGTSDEFTFAYKTLRGDGSLVARVVSNGTGTNNWAKGGVMIRQSLDGRSAYAMTAITGSSGNGACFQRRRWYGDNNSTNPSENTEATAAVAPPYWVKIERFGIDLYGSISADGVTWTPLAVDPPVQITMSDPVLIGLCVTSHVRGEDRAYQFDNIQSTVSVTGQWQGAIIESPMYNKPANMYVTVTDSMGRSQTVQDTDTDRVNSLRWSQFSIPLSTLNNVDMTRIKKMAIGVDNRANPASGGNGLVFIDDIRVIEPTPTVELIDSLVADAAGMILSINGIDVANLVLGTTTFPNPPANTDPNYLADKADDFDLNNAASGNDQPYFDTRFAVAVKTVFLIESHGNDSGYFQGLDIDGLPTGPRVPFTAWADYLRTEYGFFAGQQACGIMFTPPYPIYGIRIIKPDSAVLGFDSLSTSGVAAQ